MAAIARRIKAVTRPNKPKLREVMAKKRSVEAIRRNAPRVTERPTRANIVRFIISPFRRGIYHNTSVKGSC
jgi:hypothetical protein